MKILKKVLILFTVVGTFAWLVSLADWDAKSINATYDFQSIESEVGDELWDIIRRSYTVIDDVSVYRPIDTLLRSLCEEAGVKRSSISLHIVEAEEINAFVLPGDHMVLHTALITKSESQAELCAVIAHELAHIIEDHIVKQLMAELGIAVLTGGDNTMLGGEVADMLISSGFSRSHEEEADVIALEIMNEAKLDPTALVSFMKKIKSQEEKYGDALRYTSWLSTHPLTDDRIDYIRKEIKEKYSANEGITTDIIAPTTWQSLKKNVELISF